MEERTNKVFDNIEVYDLEGKLIAYTSKKRAADKVKDGLAISFKDGQAIKLSYSPPIKENGDSLTFRKNQCEICNGKKNLTRHHVYPRWHKMIRKLHSENLRCLCEICHKNVEEYYRWKLCPPTRYDRYIEDITKMLGQIRKLLTHAGNEDKDYGMKVLKDLLKKKETIIRKQVKERDEIIASYNFEEVYKEAQVYAQIKLRK